MNIEYLPHLVGWICGILPACGFIYYACQNRGENWRLSKLICGIALIMLGVYLAQFFLAMLSVIEYADKSEESKTVWQSLKDSSTIWLAVFPVVSMGLGINLISAWVTASPSNKNKQA